MGSCGRPKLSVVGTAQDVVAEELERDRCRRAEPAEEARHERVAMAAPRSPQPGERLLGAGAFERVSLPTSSASASSQEIAWYWPVAALAGALERLRDAVRVIGHLNAGLPARAEPALVDRVHRPALELLGGQDPLQALSARRAPRRRPRPSHAPSGRTRPRRSCTRPASRSPCRARCPRPARSGRTWFSGSPQLASAALVPETAVSLMKARRSISSGRSGSRWTPCARCGSSRRTPSSSRRCAGPRSGWRCRRGTSRTAPWRGCAARG